MLSRQDGGEEERIIYWQSQKGTSNILYFDLWWQSHGFAYVFRTDQAEYL